MGDLGILSEAFRYPAPGIEARLKAASDQLSSASLRRAFIKFLDSIGRQDLRAWEELYTRTFDFNPATAPYVGFHVWGDSYRRGAFMVQMSRALRAEGLLWEGEMPDHASLVMQILDKRPPDGTLSGVSRSSKEEISAEVLREICLTGIRRMQENLKKAEPDNPYNHLLAAAALAIVQRSAKVNG